MTDPFCPACATPYHDHKGLIPLCTQLQTATATLHNIASLIKHQQNGVAIIPAIEQLLRGCLPASSHECSTKPTVTNGPNNSGKLNISSDGIAPLCFFDAEKIIGRVVRHKHGGRVEMIYTVTDLGINAMPWAYWRDNYVFLDGSPVGWRVEVDTDNEGDDE